MVEAIELWEHGEDLARIEHGKGENSSVTHLFEYSVYNSSFIHSFKMIFQWIKTRIQSLLVMYKIYKLR